MSAEFYSIFTINGLSLLREAIQNGTKLGITAMSFGDGNGVVPAPNAEATTLVNEVYRTNLNRLAPSPNNPNWLEADAVIPSAVGGFNIREVGLWAGNTLVAYANYPATYKPSADQGTAQIKTIRIVLQIDNTANFELKIDASVVMATIQSVEDAKNEAKSYADITKIQYVNSVAEMLLLDTNIINAVQTFSYHEGKNKGGWLYKYDASKIDENNSGTILNGWIAVEKGYITPELFGGLPDGVTDNTQIYSKMVSSIPENSKIIFENGIYRGNFYSNKSLDIQVNTEATLIPTTGNNDALIMFESVSNQNFTITTEIDRGSTTIKLPASAQVKSGSLITLWNGYLRNNDIKNPINFETVRVFSVEEINSEKICTLERPTKSRQIGGNVTVYITEQPLSNVKVTIDGVLLNTDNTHWGRLLVFKRCYTPKVSKFKSKGSVAHALSYEECYGGNVDVSYFEDPLDIGSGGGYGAVAWKSSNINFGKIYSKGMRHALDYSSAYDCYTEYVKETDAKSATVVLSHNGFCGDVGVGVVDIFSKLAVHMVSTSSQGYIDNDHRLKHPIHNIDIGSIYVETTASVNDNIRVLNLDTEMRGTVNIGKVEIKFQSKVQPSTSALSSLLYVTGQAEFIEVNMLKANCIRHPCFLLTMKGNERISKALINLLEIGLSDFGIYTGGYDLHIKTFNFEKIARNYLCEIVKSGGTKYYTDIRHLTLEKYKILSGTDYPQPIKSDIILTSGSLGIAVETISTAVSADDTAELQVKDIQLKSSCLMLSPPAFDIKQSITLASLPLPTFYNGQKVKIINSRADVVKRAVVNIPKGVSCYSDLVLEHAQSIELMSVGGKWLKI